MKFDLNFMASDLFKVKSNLLRNKEVWNMVNVKFFCVFKISLAIGERLY